MDMSVRMLWSTGMRFFYPKWRSTRPEWFSMSSMAPLWREMSQCWVRMISRSFQYGMMRAVSTQMSSREVPGEQFQWRMCCKLIIMKLFERLSEGQSVLQKKSWGRLIHISDFINEESGWLIIRDNDGIVLEGNDARKIIYPGANGDPWWDTQQLLEQIRTKAVPIFEHAHPNCQALFIFDQSSAHASLGPDALNAFDMNKSNGGKQWKRHDTVIPNDDTVPDCSKRGMPQSMVTKAGEPKGLEAVLMERSFNTHGKQAKCKPVCPFENTDCCLPCILSHQADFVNQVSMLEELITQAGHLCIFLPKFHCELNPIEMVR